MSTLVVHNLKTMLHKHKGCVSKAAREFGINRALIYKAVKEDTEIFLMGDGKVMREHIDTSCKSTIAGRFVARFRKQVDKEALEEKMIDASIHCERWGDDLRYKFADGSSLINRVLLDEWSL